VRGLRAFSEMMTSAWTDESRAVEGRPDAQEESVALYTIHAAKGLEWPIVVPVNTMTQIVAQDNAVVDRTNGRFYCPVLGVRPTGYEAVRDAEKAELDRERIRLWYVAATRACELLILPRMDVAAKGSAWLSLLDLSIPSLPSLDLSHLPAGIGASATSAWNRQTREIFVDEAARIVSRQRHIRWLAPSRDEALAREVLEIEAPEILMMDSANEPIEESLPVNVQGGRERGLLLHKLIEEVLTGETEETEKALCERAKTLIPALGCSINDQALGLSPTELANSVLRALAIPEVAALRPRLMPEFPVYSVAMNLDQEEVIAGFADAIAFDPSGVPQIVVDWKSDVAPSAETIEHYRSQVRTYLDTTGAERGLIVLMTLGTVIPVTRRQIQAPR
jgi:exodeoxyribonuclease-5